MKVKIQRRTFGSQIAQERLEEQILALIPEDRRTREEYQVAASNAAVLSTHTAKGSVELDSAEAGIEEYQTFKRMVDDLDVDSAQEVWKGYQALDQAEIIPLWIELYRLAHQPLAPKAQVDGRQLSAEEKAALNDPDHPLPAPGKRGS